MKLSVAAARYESLSSQIENVRKNIRMINDLSKARYEDPINRSVVKIRVDKLEEIAEQLLEYEAYLKREIDTEI